MKFNTLLLAGALIMTSMVAVAPADASTLFGSANSTNDVTLSFNDGEFIYRATDSGYITSTGFHNATSQYYLVGTISTTKYNDYFSFNVDQSYFDPFTSASLIIPNGPVSNPGPFPITYTLFDVSATPAQLDVTRGSGDATGQMLYTDLGSGNSYGSTVITSLTASGSYTTVNLNQSFLDQINSGALTTFAIGGTLNPSTAPVAPASAVPEPAAWAMMILGMGAIGFAMRRQKVTTRVSYAA